MTGPLHDFALHVMSTHFRWPSIFVRKQAPLLWRTAVSCKNSKNGVSQGHSHIKQQPYLDAERAGHCNLLLLSIYTWYSRSSTPAACDLCALNIAFFPRSLSPLAINNIYYSNPQHHRSIDAVENGRKSFCSKKTTSSPRTFRASSTQPKRR